MLYAIEIGYDILDGDSITGLGTKVIELLNDTLLAVRVLAKGVDDPDLAKVDSSSQSSSFGMIGNELDVLNTATLCT